MPAQQLAREPLHGVVRQADRIRLHDAVELVEGDDAVVVRVEEGDRLVEVFDQSASYSDESSRDCQPRARGRDAVAVQEGAVVDRLARPDVGEVRRVLLPLERRAADDDAPQPGDPRVEVDDAPARRVRRS